MSVHPAKTQISLGICPVWSESSLCAQWVAKDPSFLHVDSEDSDQTGLMPRLIRVFAGCTLTLLVLSCSGLYDHWYSWEWGHESQCIPLLWLLGTIPAYQYLYIHKGVEIKPIIQELHSKWTKFQLQCYTLGPGYPIISEFTIPSQCPNSNGYFQSTLELKIKKFISWYSPFFFSFDRAKQPLNLNNGKFLFTIHCVPLV